CAHSFRARSPQEDAGAGPRSSRSDLIQLGGAEPRPRWSLRLLSAACVSVLIVGVLMFQLARLDVSDGPRLAALARANSIRHVVLEANRGIIYDRHGAPLVANSPVWNLTAIPAAVRRPELAELSRLVGVPEQRMADQVLAARDGYAPVTLKADLTSAEYLSVNERLPELPGVDIAERSIRTYIDPLVFGHVLGYVGPIAAPELKKLQAQGYQSDEMVGKVGVEAGLESYLRGTDGWVDEEVDARGQTVKVLATQPPIPGDAVYLTLDASLQRATAASLAAGLARDGKTAGASVVMDPLTGGVLALVSLPGYDTNLFTHGISQADYAKLLDDPNKPLLNRAIAGQYAPGSTFKMVTATAALQEGKITAQTLLSCPPYVNVNGWIYHNWASYSLGLMNVAKALATSCDTFFYQVAAMVGDVTLARYARAYGFGQAKDIELPGVMAGLVPDRIWKQVQCGVPDLNSDACRWNEGDTITFGIGQSYLLTTPLNQAVYVAALANGGRVLKPTLVTSVRDRAGHAAVSLQTVVTGTVPASPANIMAVREGMREEINQPYNMNYWFRAAGVPADGGGKTGTAQWGGSGLDLPTHAWFVFFAPYARPEIALSVFVERGELSEVEAAPIGVDIMKFYRANAGSIRS
ncbi:MAG TPA: penicillin-binding protein 2, partial [Candidatus Dormibacteraeota bacterium]|nr:penicillin-binding protein 2 [Candidatus Dormibacteraeota bacterium]